MTAEETKMLETIRRVRANVAADGKVTWTLDPYPGSPAPKVVR